MPESHRVYQHLDTAPPETPRPPPRNPTPGRIESTPPKFKPGNSTSTAGLFDKKINKDTLDDIHEGVKNEVMHATIYDDPYILSSSFPDVIFGASRNQLNITLQCRQPSSRPQSPSNVRRSSRLAQMKKSHQPTLDRRKFVSKMLSMPRNPTRTEKRESDQEDTPLDEILNYTSSSRREHKFLYGLDRGWRGWPDTSKVGAEKAVADYLNEVVKRARCFFNKSKSVPENDDDFVFSARYANKAVKNDRAQRKPDIVLVPRHHARAKESKGWGDVRAVGELKINNDYSKRELLGELAERVRLCFGSQPSRRFVLAFSLLNTKMTVWKYDRSGVLVTREFDVHKEPIAFLRTILGLALGPDYHVGYDPSFTRELDKQFVELNGKKYEVMKTIKVDEVVCGRGSVVQRVKDEEGREFIMKDQWVDRSRETKEFSTLEMLEEMGVQKVARLVDYQRVSFKVGDEDVYDSTENDRVDHVDACKEKGIETRDHYRLLISPFGEKLGTFRSLRELLSVFRDLVEGIRDVREMGMVHRDISEGNLIIVTEDDSSRRGYIIDFDYAIYVDRVGRAIAERTGTLPFMAMDILRKKDVKHEYYHDLESLFYALVWTCFTHEGPGIKRDFDFQTSPISEWMGRGKGEPNMTTIASLKMSQMQTDNNFKEFILDKLPDYFKQSKALTMFLYELRRIIFQQTPMRKEWENEEARVIPDREKSMKDRNRLDVFSEICDAFDEAIRRLED